MTRTAPRRGGVGLLLLVAVLTAGARPTPVAAQLSPGDLSRAHASLEGARHCLDCHAPRQGVAAERCLDCHQALRQRVEAGLGLHADPAYARCETCHIEHHGRDFALIYWGDEGQEAFDHEKAGWRLDGAHASVACRDCHRSANLVDRAALTAGKADLARTFLGLNTACLTCHDDQHRGQFSAASCTECHTTVTWRPAPGFDHGASDFPLRGAHAQAACAGCHASQTDPNTGVTFRQFINLAHGQCSDCHRDPHGGRLGATCRDCHTPDDWQRVQAADFDHNRTRFPLTGRHRTVACQGCHAEGASSTADLAFATCASCHRDPHDGRLGSTCASCHQTSGWQQVADAAFDHGQTRFPLRGSHASVACVDCHGAGPRAGVRQAFAACADCHADPHLGQMTAACADCHTEERFVPATFTVTDHAQTAFPLEGAHQAVPCVDCHLLTEPEALPPGITVQHSRLRAAPAPAPTRTRTPTPTPESVRRFRFASTACASCHDDPHDGTAPIACVECHQMTSFRQVAATGVAFDHAGATGFALTGGHAGVGCASCHGALIETESATIQGAPTIGDRGGLRFDPVRSVCSDCHQDPHFGTTSSPGPNGRTPVDCAQCHVSTAWDTTRFDHARDANFVLDGAHARLDCAACHLRGLSAPVGERPAVPPTTCEGCHGGGAFISLSSTES